MYPALIFHSFNNNPNSDRFYDLKIENFISLIDFISQKIKPTKITLTFDDGFKSIIPAVEYSLKKDLKLLHILLAIILIRMDFLQKKISNIFIVLDV